MSDPQPGIEVKTWFPLATEITARFKDSQSRFSHNQTKVALVTWIPDFIIAGEPKIVGVWIGEARVVAHARDTHYHHPPDYIVVEPEDTTTRTSNLQQTNCKGMGFQGTPAQLEDARRFIQSWGPGGGAYQFDREYQALLRELTAKFPYREDTNFGKMDRIMLPDLEIFKRRILGETHYGRTVQEWVRAIRTSNPEALSVLINPLETIPVQ